MSTDQLNRTFAALADPTRRAILARLSRGEATATELGKPFGLSQPTISKHLKVLTLAKLVKRRRDAQFQRCQLDVARLESAWLWLSDFARFWDESFDRLDGYAKALLASENKEQADGRRKR